MGNESGRAGLQKGLRSPGQVEVKITCKAGLVDYPAVQRCGILSSAPTFDYSGESGTWQGLLTGC